MKLNAICLTSILLFFTSCSHDSRETTKKGEQLYDSKKYAEAIVQFSSAIEMNPQDTTAYFTRGLSYMQQNNLKDAKPDFDKVIEISKNAINTYFYRGCCNMVMGNYKAAISDISTYLKKSNISTLKNTPGPEFNNYAYFVRGASYYKLEDNKKALPDLMKHIELGGNDPQAFLFIGYINNASGFEDIGLSYITKASSLGNEEAKTYLDNYRKQHVSFSDARSLVEERISERGGSIIDAYVSTAFKTKSYLFLVNYGGEFCNMMVSENALEILAVKCGGNANILFYETKSLNR